MLFGNRGARSSGTKQRKSEAFQPRGEALEPKVLLALLQLGAGTPKNIAGITTTAPAGPQTMVRMLPFIADSSGLNPQVQGTRRPIPAWASWRRAMSRRRALVSVWLVWGT